MTTKHSGHLMPIFLLIIAIISTQTGASIVKQLFPLVGSQGAIALRFTLSAIILCIIFKPWRMRFERKAWLPIGLYGLSLGFMGFLFYFSIARIPLGIAVGLEFAGPLTLALFASRRPVDFIWVVLAIVGILLLIPFDQSTEHLDIIGVLYALGAGVCWAIYIIVGQKVGTSHGARTVALGTLVATIVFLPIGIEHAGAQLFSPSILMTALLVAILSTALPFTLELIALARLPMRTFGTLMSLDPAFAALSGLILLSEQLTLIQWVALFAICISSIGATLTIERPTPKTEHT
ncbi:threonine/homoserine exporter RhtA [Neisseria sp. Ec49-e6-T10]|uniref:threonine/homoserine exporter RhtA n=1 Tax=Neisseria sp. Ec49-e6-T10 TaxID=3140744 RepID=UPI003EBD01A1